MLLSVSLGLLVHYWIEKKLIRASQSVQLTLLLPFLLGFVDARLRVTAPSLELQRAEIPHVSFP